MALYRDQGVVLRSMRLGEADRIVTLLTIGHGKVRAVAKGVRKTKSRFGARLDPFGHVDLLVYEGRGELHTVSQAELLASFAHIRADFDAYALGQVMCEAADKVAPDHEPNQRLVQLVLAGLRAVDTHAATGRGLPHAVRPAYLLKLLGISGFAPSLRHCAHCGGADGLSGFSLAEGGVVCSTCRQGSDVMLHPESVAFLQYLWATPLAEIGEAHPGEVDGLVQRAVEYHLERRLRSLELRPA